MFGRLSWLTMTLIHIVRSLSLALLMLTHEANAQSLRISPKSITRFGP